MPERSRWRAVTPLLVVSDLQGQWSQRSRTWPLVFRRA
jgi:hypothetical protein